MGENKIENALKYFVQQFVDGAYSEEIDKRLKKANLVNEISLFVNNINYSIEKELGIFKINYNDTELIFQGFTEEMNREFKTSDIEDIEFAWEYLNSKNISNKKDYLKSNLSKLSNYKKGIDYLLQNDKIIKPEEGFNLLFGKLFSIINKQPIDDNLHIKIRAIDDLIYQFYELFKIPDSCMIQAGHHLEVITNNWIWDLILLVQNIKAKDIVTLTNNLTSNEKTLIKINAQYPYYEAKKEKYKDNINNDIPYSAKLYNRNLLKELIGFANIDFIQPVNNRTRMDLFDESWKNPQTIFDLTDYWNYSNKFIDTYFKKAKNKDIKQKNCVAHYFWYWFDTNANVKEFYDVFGKKFDLKDTPKQIIFYGPPGTGKTRYAILLASVLTNFETKKMEIIQFHPNYGYENFIEGIHPISENGDINYVIEDGIFLKFLRKAEKDPDNNYVFIIDEINRADVSRVFGELLLMLEYREPKYATPLPESSSIKNIEDRKNRGMEKCRGLNNSEPNYWVPPNVYLLGTMNTLDKSLIQMDFAFKRRFFWYPIVFDKKALLNIITVGSFSGAGEESLEGSNKNEMLNLFIMRCEMLNSELRNQLGPDYEIGHAYYMKITRYMDEKTEPNITFDVMTKLWIYDIEPLIKEYLGTRSLKDLEKYKKVFLNE